MQGRVDVRRPQIGDQQVIAAGHVQRQETVAVVITVEEAVLLLAVDGIVGGVEVEDQFLGRRRLRRDKALDQSGGHLHQVGAADAVLQAAQGGRGGQLGSVVGSGVIDGGLPEGIVTEPLVVVEIFVTASDAKNPLGQQATLRVGNEVRVAGVGDGVVQGVEEAKAAVGLTQKQYAGVRGEDASGEISLERTSFGTGKRQRRCGTLCHRGGPRIGEGGFVLTLLSTNSWTAALLQKPSGR